MSFAVVELKYTPRKTFIVPISWIKNYKPTQLPTVEFYCYISTNLKADPNFQSKYYMKFNGTAGLFKVFILTVTDSVLDAITYQEQRRIKSIPQKFRQPGNTDAELNVERSKRKKKENSIKKSAQQNAKATNMAHLGVLLGNAPSKNVAAKSFVDGSQQQQKQAIEAPVVSTVFPNPNSRVLEVECQEHPVVAPVDSPTEQMSPNAATGIDSQPIIYSNDSSIVYSLQQNEEYDMPPNDAHVFKTGIETEGQPTIYLYDSSTITTATNYGGDMPPNDAHVFETGIEIEGQRTIYLYDSSTITTPTNDGGDMPPNDAHILEAGIDSQSQPIIITYDSSSNTPQNETEVLPIGLPSSFTNDHTDIVRLAMECLEGIGSASASQLHLSDDLDSADEYRCDTNDDISGNGPNTTNAGLVDVPLNNSGNNRQIRNFTIDSSLFTPSSSASQPHKCGKENTLPMQENDDVPIQGIDYKKAYLQLKEKNSSLDERNMALQNALVAADKALGKVPEVPYATVDGGRMYKGGVFLDSFQCKILDTTSDNNKYVNNLAVAVFGTEALKKSSVTGIASKNKNLPAKPGLNPLWLQLVYDLIDAKTNRRLSVSEVNKILNKKISNLNGAEKRKNFQLNGGVKRKVKEHNNEESGKVGNGTVVSTNSILKPNASRPKLDHLSTTTM